MKFTPTTIADVVLIEPRVFEDGRGWFTESFNERAFALGLAGLGLAEPDPFVQDNHSSSGKGVLRGLHYQVAPDAQAKLVRVVSGRAFDVAVDIRTESATFGQWVGVELSASNRLQLWIPAGFAHGFLALDDDTQFVYKATRYYAPGSERTLRWDDPQLDIAWQLPMGKDAPILAAKDASAPGLQELRST